MITKKHRLEAEIYNNHNIVAFTLCFQNKINESYINNIFEILESVISEISINYKIKSSAYLLMPDHFHIIIQKLDEYSDILKAIKMFKQKSGFIFSQNYPEVKWQKSFYDHIIRNENDLLNQSIYIFLNPVRKGLIENWKYYKYKGSQVYDLNDFEL